MMYASYVAKNDIFYITKRHLPSGGCFFDTHFSIKEGLNWPQMGPYALIPGWMAAG